MRKKTSQTSSQNGSQSSPQISSQSGPQTSSQSGLRIKKTKNTHSVNAFVDCFVEGLDKKLNKMTTNTPLPIDNTHNDKIKAEKQIKNTNEHLDLKVDKMYLGMDMPSGTFGTQSYWTTMLPKPQLTPANKLNEVQEIVNFLELFFDILPVGM